MYSYSGNPGASVLDAVRFEVQDTNSEAPLLQDEEIEYTITQEAPGTPPSEGEVLSAAARCLETLARLFSAQADTQVGSLQVTYSKQALGYAAQAKSLRLRAQGMHAPWAGGQSESEKQSRREEIDRVQPMFVRRQFGNPYIGSVLSADSLQPGEGGR